ncbi:MAG: AMIN domain-containing protein [Leptolyngbya sp. SIOISBB]|nr:AMIN domain-containing protein [Leptolyngbya sp. SIOISBB]
MKRLLGYGSCLASTTLLAIVAQPALATSTVITGIQVVPTDTGAQIVLQTENGETPQVFAVNQGSMLRADIVRTQLQLPDGDQFVQQNPAPGIQAIALAPLDSNSVRLTVEGSGSIPTGVVGSSNNGDLIIDVATQAEGAAPQGSTPVPSDLETVASDEPVLIPVEQPATVAQAEVEDSTEEVEPAAPQPDVLVPNPQVIIDGVPVDAPEVQAAPPFLPAATAPPVGDIAIAETIPTFNAIDLGTTERVPRLVLRDAPSREVLNLLARAAGLNLVFIDPDGEVDTGAEATGTGEGPPITLDIENESVQDVFNSVLRVTGLQANRVGRTIYVAPELPDSARNLVSRTLRLNQVAASNAAGFLVALGAEGTQIVTATTFTDVGEGLGEIEGVETGGDSDAGDLGTDLRLIERSTSTNIVPLAYQPVEGSGSPQVLQGLLVTVDDRTNSITLTGDTDVVTTATSYLARLDLRRRQVAVNVKVIDVNLSAIDAFGTSFSFSVGDFDFSSNGGVGVVNFGGSTPFTAAGSVPTSTPISPGTLSGGGGFSVGDDFLFQLLASVQEGNSKILTDPTLIIQEGQTASVALTQQIVSRVTQEVVDIGDTAFVAVEPELVDAGLVLGVNVDRIDDNGFVSLSVSPSLTAPVATVDVGAGVGSVTLLNARELQSGLIRVRDGQTLVLSGIIQETDQVSTTKVPILGDIPILGALFRSTSESTSRNELIVLLTPEILDDTDQSVFGYSYTPSEEVQEIIERSQQR